MAGYCFSKWSKFLFNGDKVIIGNGYSGKWTKITKECYEIVKEGIEKEYSINQVLEFFTDPEDKLYLTELFECLQKIDVIKEAGKIEEEPSIGVVIGITQKCNLKCRHCFVSASPEISQELSYDDVISIINKLTSIDCTSITFTGGEPLCHEKFLQILEYTRKNYKGTISLMTNGTLISNENVKQIIKNVDRIDISIDGINEDTCSKIRGQGVFNKVINTIHLLHSYDFTEISLSMVMTKENSKYADQFDELNKELGTKPLKRLFSPVGRGERNKEEFKTQIEPKERKAMDVTKARQLLKVCHCGALTRTLYISYDGNLYPCNTLDKPKYALGNIYDFLRQDDFLERCRHRSNTGYMNLQSIYPENYDKCKDCNVNLFCWECVHLIDMWKTGNIEITDCSQRQSDLQEIIWND